MVGCGDGIGNDPVAHPELEEGIPFVLAVGFGNDVEAFGGLNFAANTPGQADFAIFTKAGSAQVGVDDQTIIGQRNAGRDIEIGRTGLPVAGQGGVAGGQTDAIRIGCQRLEQGFSLNHPGAAIPLSVSACPSATESQFKVAAGVAGRQGPEFVAFTMQVKPALDLAGLSVGAPAVLAAQPLEAANRRQRR
jgi:hypothetical protein